MRGSRYVHLGEVGQKLIATGTVESKKAVWSRRGWSRCLLALVRVRCGDATIVLFTKDEWEKFTEAGEQITIAGTVREHRVWHDENLTVLGNAKRPGWTIEDARARLRTDAWEKVNASESGPRPFPCPTDPLATPQASAPIRAVLD